MSERRFSIVQDPFHKTSSSPRFFSSRAARYKELEAKFERLWLINPEQFNPLRNCMQKDRLDRTWRLIQGYLSLNNIKAVDIGCAAGVFSRQLRDAGAEVDAVDIAENALKYLRQNDMQNIKDQRDTMPATSLPGDHYDLVVCNEVIADLPPEDFRLFFSELSRLVKSTGHVVCSTPLDIHTIGASQRFIDLAKTELDLLDCIPSYHALYLRLKKICHVPRLYVKAWNDPNQWERDIKERKGFKYWMFWLNTTPIMIWLWLGLGLVTKPLLHLLNTNTRLLLMLEKICYFIQGENGLSHLILIGKRRPLMPEEPDEAPIERPKKKEIWE